MPLETLPPELLHHILASTSSLADLSSLAFTHPRLYAVFRREQAALMYCALATDLGPVMADALGLAETQVLDGTSRRFVAMLGEVLDLYGRYLEKEGERGYPSARRVELEFVLRLARWYRAVSFVTEVYLECQLRLFEREVRPSLGILGISSDSEPSSSGWTEEEAAMVKEVVGRAVVAPPSGTERLRVLRAFYRLQIVLLVWGSPCFFGQGAFRPDVTSANWRLFGLWEVWEVQQVFCAGVFYQRFRCQFADVYLGRDSDDPRRRLLTDRLRFGFDEFRDFVRQARLTDDTAWQTALDRASTLLPTVEAAGEEEGRAFSWFRCRLYQDYKIWRLPERHRFRKSYRFLGDSVGAVPFGWVDALDGHLEYDYWGVMGGIWREGKPTQGIWSRLGFVMWDAPRVGALKTSFFLWHCKTGWARSGRSTWSADPA